MLSKSALCATVYLYIIVCALDVRETIPNIILVVCIILPHDSRLGGTITMRNHYLYEGNQVKYSVYLGAVIGIVAFFFVTIHVIPADGLCLSRATAKANIVRIIIFMIFQILSELYFDDIRQGVFDELQGYNERVEKATKAKEVFFACMSHEIRNPLQSLMGSVDLLQQATDKERRDAYIKIIKNGCDVVLNLVSNILDVSKIEAKKMEISMHPSSLTENLEKIVRLLSERATGKGLSLEYKELSAIPPCMLLDPQRLQQVVINLLSNALKFTQRGRVLLTVTWISLDSVSDEADIKAVTSRELKTSEWKSMLYPILEVEDEKEEQRKRTRLSSVQLSSGSGQVFTMRTPTKLASSPSSAEDGEDARRDGLRRRENTVGSTSVSPLRAPPLPLSLVQEEVNVGSEYGAPRRSSAGQRATRFFQRVVKGLVKIEVMDTGIGIKKEGIDRLFKPYQQADATISQYRGMD